MTKDYLQQASEEHDAKTQTDMTVPEFLEHAQENPNAVADSVNYLLAAIEHFGTRTVFEDGKEKERYRFFDDPYEDGEHAILGNTEILNDFVDELRRRASDEGEGNKIIWFLGPTATGKSELKRCIINGLKGFAETEEGARWTLAWTLDQYSSDARMAYGDGTSATKNWYESPININPLSILPEETREEFLEDLDAEIDVDTALDPFSREAMEMLEDNFDSFSEVIQNDSVKVSRYYPEVGDGIGVLHSEDDGNEKQKLVGSWMQGAMQKFAKRGRKNPQAFSYDGVLSQGNGLVSIVEDASHHSDVLDKMLNLCEEEMVKLDNKISMDLDTLIIAFSNPDLEGQLEEYSEAGQSDPLRALRRRLDKYEFEYLTTFSLEALLIRRLLQDGNWLWDDVDDRIEKVVEPLELYGSEIAPRSIEVAAVYEVATRLDDSDVTCNAINNTLLLEHGECESNGELHSLGDLIAGEDYTTSGKNGIPVTYTIDVIVELAQEKDVVLPVDIVEGMSEGVNDEPLFNESERKKFGKVAFDAIGYIRDQQEDDVLEAMVGDIEVTEDDVREYIDSILAWQEDNSDEYDAYELKEFETRYLGQDEKYYGSNAGAGPKVKDFREEIISPVNKYMWDQRDDDFTVDDVPISESPSLRPLLEENDWDTVARIFPDANINQWENPPSNTQTEELKEKTVNRMIEMFDYSEESAEQVSKEVVETYGAENEVITNGA